MHAMESQQDQDQVKKSRVLVLENEESWDYYLTKANQQSCPIVIHFSASWCVPSIAMKRYFEELAMDYQDILFLMIDVDELQGVASKFDIKAMPTFVFMNDGNQVDRIVGADPSEIKKRVGAFASSVRTNT